VSGDGNPIQEFTDEFGIAKTNRMFGNATTTGVPLLVAAEMGSSSDRCDYDNSRATCNAYKNEAVKANHVTYFSLNLLTPEQRKARSDAQAILERIQQQKDDVARELSEAGTRAAATTAPRECLKETPAAPANENWTNIPGAARDVALYSLEQLWVVGTDFQIYLIDVLRNKYQVLPGLNSANRLAFGQIGPLVVTLQGDVMEWEGAPPKYRGWVHVTSDPSKRVPAYDIGANKNGVVWITSKNGEIFRLKPDKTWEKINVNTKMRNIAVDPDGNAWVTSFDDEVFHYKGDNFKGDKWEQEIGLKAYDIGIGAEGSIFATSSDQAAKTTIHKWMGCNWYRLKGNNARYIAVDSNGIPVIAAYTPSFMYYGYETPESTTTEEAKKRYQARLLIEEQKRKEEQAKFLAELKAQEAAATIAAANACPSTIDMTRLDCFDFAFAPIGQGTFADDGKISVYNLSTQIKWRDGTPIRNAMVAFHCVQPTLKALGKESPWGCRISLRNMSTKQATDYDYPILVKTDNNGYAKIRYPEDGMVYLYNVDPSEPLKVVATLVPDCPVQTYAWMNKPSSDCYPKVITDPKAKHFTFSTIRLPAVPSNWGVK
jgi:hypothetical protein